MDCNRDRFISWRPDFVDSNDENCPVYTAMHGEGEWELECIAERIEDIIEKVKGNVGK